MRKLHFFQVKRFVAETKGRGEEKTTRSGKRAASCLGNVKYFRYHEKESQTDKAIVKIDRFTDIKMDVLVENLFVSFEHKLRIIVEISIAARNFS